jgi:hypothetical protein
MRPILRGKYLDERLRHFPTDAAENHIRSPSAADGLMLAIWVP